jgi:hypothetical protein
VTGQDLVSDAAIAIPSPGPQSLSLPMNWVDHFFDKSATRREQEASLVRDNSGKSSRGLSISSNVGLGTNTTG